MRILGVVTTGHDHELIKIALELHRRLIIIESFCGSKKNILLIITGYCWKKQQQQIGIN